MSGIQVYLTEIQNKCSEYSEKHLQTYKRYKTQNTIFNIISIVITGGIATLTASTAQIDKNTTSFTVISIISPILLYVSATLNSIQQLLNFEQMAEAQRVLSVRFIALGNNIKRFLTVEELQRQDIIEYFKWASSTFEELISKTSSLEIETTDLQISPFDIHSLNNELIETGDTVKQKKVVTFSELPVVDQNSARIKYETDRFISDSYGKV